MTLTDHPFLATDGTWQSGATRSDDGRVERLDRRSTVRRVPSGWEILVANDWYGGDTPQGAVRYDVRPPRQRGERADWTAIDPRYGRLIGQLVAVDDSISSTFISVDGRISGSEWLMLEAGDRYRALGLVLDDGELANRWSLTLCCASSINVESSVRLETAAPLTCVCGGRPSSIVR